LLSYDDDQFQAVYLRILEKAARDQSRRADIEQLRKLGLRLDSGYENRNRNYNDRQLSYPQRSNYGISVKESVDYIGSDPTDVIAGQIGRQMDRVGSLFGDLTGSQADALQQLIKSRNINTERVARALERKAEAEADTAKIKALAEAVKRTHSTRQIDVQGGNFGTLLNQLNLSNPQSENEDKLQRVFTVSCNKCHDPNRETYQAGRLDLSDYRALTGGEFAAVIKRVRGGSMPPTGEPPLTPDQERILIDGFVSKTVSGE